MSWQQGDNELGWNAVPALRRQRLVVVYAWSLSAGSLPPGLILNATTGAITGKPTARGTFPFTAKVTEANGKTATKALSIKIN